MKTSLRNGLLVSALALPLSLVAVGVYPQVDEEFFKVAAIEALMTAPPEKSVPILKEFLAGDNSDGLKSRALFVLAQSDSAEAEGILLDYATTSSGELQLEAIRMIGISGDDALLDQLLPLYRSGDEQVRESVLQAYMISDRADSVLRIAQDAQTDEEFEAAVRMLGVMNATELLKELRDSGKASEGLVQAFAIAGDTESLTAMALDGSDKKQQLQAIQGLGIADEGDTAATLMQIYQDSDDPEIRSAAMQALMIAGADEALLTLFRDATDPQDKAMLLKQLVLTDSDAALEAINAALSEKP